MGSDFFASDLMIREARDQDASAIRDLVFGVLAEFGLNSDVDDTDRDLFAIEESYVDRGGRFELLVDPSGRILGTIGLYPVDGETVELRKMYFLPEIRGLGYGKKLLDRAIATAREMGFSRIYLETALVLKQAVQLYEKAGFKPVDIRHSPRCDQAYILDLCAYK